MWEPMVGSKELFQMISSIIKELKEGKVYNLVDSALAKKFGLKIGPVTKFKVKSDTITLSQNVKSTSVYISCSLHNPIIEMRINEGRKIFSFEIQAAHGILFTCSTHADKVSLSERTLRFDKDNNDTYLAFK